MTRFEMAATIPEFDERLAHYAGVSWNIAPAPPGPNAYEEVPEYTAARSGWGADPGSYDGDIWQANNSPNIAGANQESEYSSMWANSAGDFLYI